MTDRAEISNTPPGLMSGPAWRVEPSCVISEALEKGPEVPFLSDIVGMPEAPRVWQLGPMQAVYLQVDPTNGPLLPWKCLHPPSLGY